MKEGVGVVEGEPEVIVTVEAYEQRCDACEVELLVTVMTGEDESAAILLVD